MKTKLKRHCYPVVILLLLLGISFKGQAQTNATVTGIVRDEAGAVLPDVTITVINESDSALQKSTITNDKGVFSFNQLVPGSKYRFTVSHVGYQQQVIRNYSVKAGENTAVAISLVAAANAAMDEVIVVGYGTQKRVNATGAVDQITSKIWKTGQ